MVPILHMGKLRHGELEIEPVNLTSNPMFLTTMNIDTSINCAIK